MHERALQYVVYPVKTTFNSDPEKTISMMILLGQVEKDVIIATRLELSLET
jgi:hypothetical protein